MLAGLVATALSLFLFAGLYAAEWPYAFLSLLLARAIYGLFAGAVQPVATAWMAGMTRREKRAAGVAQVGAAVAIAGIAGPLLAASVVGLGLSVPVAAGGAVVALAAVAMRVGVREERPKPAPPGIAPSTRGGLTPCLAVAFAMVVGFGALQPTTAFFVQDRFRLDTAAAIRDAGFASACFAASSFVVQAFVVRRLAAAGPQPAGGRSRLLPARHRRQPAGADIGVADRRLRRSGRGLWPGPGRPERDRLPSRRRASAGAGGRAPAGRPVRRLDCGCVGRHRALSAFDRRAAVTSRPQRWRSPCASPMPGCRP
jgi:MFS family permease